MAEHDKTAEGTPIELQDSANNNVALPQADDMQRAEDVSTAVEGDQPQESLRSVILLPRTSVPYLRSELKHASNRGTLSERHVNVGY
jgi:hypothetical protein